MFLTAVFAVAVLILSCNPQDSGECTPIANPDKGVELISPDGGSLDYGSTVYINWKADPSRVEQVALQVSTSGINGPWRHIFSHGIDVPPDNDIVCMDTLWTIGDEYESNLIDYGTAGTILLRVASYNELTNEALRDVSSSITVRMGQ